MKKVLLIAAFILFPTLIAMPDSIRGPLVAIVTPKPDQPVILTIGLEDLVAVLPPADLSMIDGIEIEVRIPPVIRQYRDSFAWYLYKSVEPLPSLSLRSYTGTRSAFELIPTGIKVFYLVPLRKAHTMAGGLGTVLLPFPVLPEEMPLFMTILPVMKGIPPEAIAGRFEIAIRAVSAPSGSLILRIHETSPSAGSYSVMIDEKPFAGIDGKVVLPIGIHHLRIESSGYQNINLSFGIEQGVLTELDVTLIPLVPMVSIEAPKGTQIFFDGKRFEGQTAVPFEVTEGPHTVVFTVGEYTLSRKFTAEKGKTYSISILLDIAIQEILSAPQH